jgi:hypothetical protein
MITQGDIDAMKDATELLPCPFCGGGFGMSYSGTSSVGYVVTHDGAGCILSGFWDSSIDAELLASRINTRAKLA